MYSFITCMGLHLCVYAFMLLRAYGSQALQFFKLVKVSLSLIWPAAVVYIGGSRCFQDGVIFKSARGSTSDTRNSHVESAYAGVIQIALAIVLLMTALGQEYLLLSGFRRFGEKYTLVLYVCVSLALALMVCTVTMILIPWLEHTHSRSCL